MSVLFYLHNLDQSGANQVIFNILKGGLCASSQAAALVVSPHQHGPFKLKLEELGIEVRSGKLSDILEDMGKEAVRCVIANTLMTADVVVRHCDDIPIYWLVHEWWDEDMLRASLANRSQQLSVKTVKQAFKQAASVVFVCAAQKQFYIDEFMPEIEFIKSCIIHCGTPDSFAMHETVDLTNVSICAGNHSAGEGLEILKNADCRSGTSLSSLSSLSSIGSTSSSGLGSNNDSISNGFKNISKPFVFLVLGIICPRKNQLWAVRLFQEFSKMYPRENHNIKLVIVGARYSRAYEVAYLDEIKEQIGKDSADGSQIEIFDVTNDVDKYYQESDCLLMLSSNEVTPLVILEAYSCSIPVIATNIAGIPEMLDHKEEGMLVALEDDKSVLAAMRLIYENSELRREMGRKGRERYLQQFALHIMVDKYRNLLLLTTPEDLSIQDSDEDGDNNVEIDNSAGSGIGVGVDIGTSASNDNSLYTILVDMDNTLCDWDASFLNVWNGRSLIDRERSFYMEDCLQLDSSESDSASYELHDFRSQLQDLRKSAIAIFHKQGFFESIPAKDGAIEAMLDMERLGFNVKIVTSPILTSSFCCQEKMNWVRRHLGEEWLRRVIICADKTSIKGHVLIDDKPDITNNSAENSATIGCLWKQVIFDAPYNQDTSHVFRLQRWRNWRVVVGRAIDSYLEDLDKEAAHLLSENQYIQRIGSSSMGNTKTDRDRIHMLSSLNERSAQKTTSSQLPSNVTSCCSLQSPFSSTNSCSGLLDLQF